MLLTVANISIPASCGTLRLLPKAAFLLFLPSGYCSHTSGPRPLFFKAEQAQDNAVIGQPAAKYFT